MHLFAEINYVVIEDAMQRWRQAFENMGNSKKHQWQIWSEQFQVALLAGMQGTKYSYSLLDHRTSTKNKRGIVEVNPPRKGRPQGNNQGVVAHDQDGNIFLLRRDRLSLAKKHVKLSDMTEIHNLPTRVVQWPDGSTEECYLVSDLGADDATIVGGAAAFMIGCKRVRAQIEGEFSKNLEGIQKAKYVEELCEQYEQSAREARIVLKKHPDLTNTLSRCLEKHGHRVSNERVSRLGPDIYTISEKKPCLFELKTGCGSGDYLKAVGQLIVYEQYLGKKYRKFAVFPEGIPNQVIKTLKKLDISIVNIRVINDVVHFEGLPDPS